MSDENTQMESQLKTLQQSVNQLEIRYDKVILDVGGEKYITSVDTLTREKDTFFTTLFENQWELKRDPDDKSIFIDGNGKIFIYILEYLRTSAVPNDVWKDEAILHSLIIEAQYFRLHNLIGLLDIFPNGTLLQQQHKIKLNEFYGKINQRWELIYKASRDGFEANAFHAHCDNKGPTITIIQSNKAYLFGGYTSISWAPDKLYKNDSTAFLFTLTNPHNIPPTKYFIKAYGIGNAIYGGDNYGPTFGAGHDIYLANNSNSNAASYIRFPHSYTDTTGKYNKTFVDDEYFATSDIEVFKLA